jgi:hypothetical protein
MVSCSLRRHPAGDRLDRAEGPFFIEVTDSEGEGRNPEAPAPFRARRLATRYFGNEVCGT